MISQEEILEPLYMNEEFSKVYKHIAQINGERVRRMDISGRRYYQTKAGRFYTSLTTFLGMSLPTSKILLNWQIAKALELGSQELEEEYVEATADYGTGLHVAVAEFARRGYVVWSEFEFWVYDWIRQSGFGEKSIHLAANELRNDFAAMVEFIYRYDVEIIAVEIPIYSDELGVASASDLVVRMRQPNDKYEDLGKIKAIINLKSGKKGFYDTHEYQLCGERLLFNELYGEAYGKIDYVFNLAPNNWRTSPTFKLKDQTENANLLQDNFLFYNKIAWNNKWLEQPKNKFTLIEGRTEFGESVLVKSLNATEMAAYKYSKDK
jgi:hypothetical protein